MSIEKFADSTKFELELLDNAETRQMDDAFPDQDDVCEESNVTWYPNDISFLRVKTPERLSGHLKPLVIETGMPQDIIW